MRKDKKQTIFGILKDRIAFNKSTKLVLVEKEETSRYRDLAPKDNPEKIAEYISALDWAFNNKNIRNIAIAGPYGAGKSSIINAWEV